MTSRTHSPRKAPAAPPPVLSGFRVVAYASIKRPITYSGRSGLFVGPLYGEAKEIGPVPRLAIGQALRGAREFALLHCSRRWTVLGAQGAYRSLAEVKRRANRSYPGVSDAWVATNVTIREAKRFERDQWQPWKCSFCGRIPPEQETTEQAIVITVSTACICGRCILDFAEEITRRDS